jgi:two-component SAPR family response regulator
MGGPDERLYAFGPFVADPVTGTLRQDGVHVVLTLKSFEVLLVLIERRGQVVDKDVLLKLVWPDTIVEENNLARHISTLRKPSTTIHRITSSSSRFPAAAIASSRRCRNCRAASCLHRPHRQGKTSSPHLTR